MGRSARPPRGVQMVDKHLEAEGGGDTTVHNRLLPLLAISEGVDGAEREKIGCLSLARSRGLYGEVCSMRVSAVLLTPKKGNSEVGVEVGLRHPAGDV